MQMRAPRPTRLAGRLSIALLVLTTTMGRAQGLGPQQRFEPPPVPQEGLHYYAIQNLDSGAVEQRGVTGSNGIAFSNLILAPNTPYRIWVLQARTLAVANPSIITPGNGQRFVVPPLNLHVSTSRDTDGDGLHDEGEFILGTINNRNDPHSKDSDQDGILDGAEVLQGLDPLDGRAVRTGLIGTADTPGTAVDVCALNDIVAVADADRGVSVFNVFNGMNPLIISQVDTPGSAERVACTDMFIAIADGDAGLAIVDISDPPAARVVHQVRLPGTARAVAAAGGIAYVGLESGQLVAVDLASGEELSRVNTGGGVHDVAIEGEAVFVLLANELQAYSALPEFELQGRATPSAFQAEGITGRKRVFVGGGIAYVTSFPGFDTFDVTNLRSPRRIGTAGAVGPNSFKQIIANGSGLGVAAVGVNPRDDGTHDVFLYDISKPAITTDFITQFVTPGLTRAVSIYNGIAYAADGTAGLQVVNYLAYDVNGVAPTIRIETSLRDGIAEEGGIFRVTAHVSDDVQVRNVEFYIDGAKVATDGNFPFEQRLRAARLRDQPSFTLQARASDTGGNATFSEELAFTLVPDATPPRVRRTNPGDGSVGPIISTVAAFFSESINPATLTPASFSLTWSGPDGILDTADDTGLSGTLELQDDVLGAFLSVAGGLRSGRYRAQLTTAIKDLAGNALAAPVRWEFTIFEVGPDRDGDGVPDSLEPVLHLDPDNPDTNGDGTPDGAEDFDADGLSNFGEVLLGTDPTKPDSNGNGVRDGDEDSDGDGLSDAQEVARGTNPRTADTDKDGWPDGAEVDAGSNPLGRFSQPRLTVVAIPPVSVVRPGLEDVTGLAPNTTVAAPPVSVVLPDTEDIGNNLPPNVTIAVPPVTVVLPAAEDVSGGDLVPNVTLAQPPVTVVLPDFTGGGDLASNVTVAQPPVSVVIQAAGEFDGLAPNVTVARPPVTVRFSSQ
jgi:hypothetical protein